MNKSKKNVIEFKNISFQYTEKNVILSHISFSIFEGETVGIVGANGAGKSTVLKLIAGLLEPKSGMIYVCDTQLKPKNIKMIRKKIGYTFQEPDNQLFMPTVFEDIAFGFKQIGKSNDEINKIVNNSLNEVESIHLMNKTTTTLSGGEKRIVTLATALSSYPEVLLLDEPSVGLDPRSRRNLMNILAKRSETKLIATHDMDMALQLCDRIIVLYKGVIHADDTPEKIFADEVLLYQNHLEQPLCMQGNSILREIRNL